MSIPKALATCALVTLLGATTASAQSDALADCEALAANPYQPGYETTGVDQLDMDTAAAIAACELAIEAAPDSIAAKAWLARAHYIDKSYDGMFPHVEIAAEAGNALAQQLLGDALAMGRGTERDLERSFELLTASAEQDYIPGIYSLGLSHLYGEGTPVDTARAAELFEVAVQADLSYAKSDLAGLLLEGEGVEQDVDRAVEILGEAAEQGDGYAMFVLGRLYQDGEHVERDMAKALDWHLKADAAGEVQAAVDAAFIYLGEEGPVQDIAEAVRLAQKAADAGIGQGHYALGFIAQSGYEGEADLDAARMHYRAGAELGDQMAIDALAAMDDSDT